MNILRNFTQKNTQNSFIMVKYITNKLLKLFTFLFIKLTFCHSFDFSFLDNSYTYPLVNSNILLLTNNINIMYQSSITISTKNIFIYQYNNENPILSQLVP